jgi:ankyrin repeat protein
LHLACLAGHESAVAMLLQWPQLYPISAKNNSGASVLSFAVLSGSRKCVSMILGSRNESEVDALLSGVWTGKRTPLHLAAMMGASEVVEELLKIKRVGLEAFDLVGFTPLLWAAYVGHAETVVRWFLLFVAFAFSLFFVESVG